MCKHPSESNNIDYDKITADAIQNHNDVLVQTFKGNCTLFV